MQVRSLLLGLAFALFAFAAQAADTPRLTGEVNYKTYPGFAAYLKARGSKPIAIDVTIPLDNEDGVEGHLTTYVLDGQFQLAYLAGTKSSTIYSDTGVELVDNDTTYTLKGVFKVTSDEPAGETPYLSLEEVDSPAGAHSKDVKVSSLKPGAN